MEYVRKGQRIGIKDEIEELRSRVNSLEVPQREQEFRMPYRWKRTLGKSKKKGSINKILFVMLKANGKVDGPHLTDYSDNILIYNFKPYEIDPRAIWDWGKYRVYFYKEKDRRPVSNLNLKEIMRRGDLTDSDELLIKTVMRSVYGSASKRFNIKALIVGIVFVAIVLFAFFYFA